MGAWEALRPKVLDARVPFPRFVLSKWRATGRTLKEAGAGRSFSDFDNHRVNNFQMERLVFKPRQPTAALPERFRNQKAAVRDAFNGSDRSLCRVTSSHDKSLAVRKNHDRWKRPIKKRINADCFERKTLPCCELAQVIVFRDPYTADRISLCGSGKRK